VWDFVDKAEAWGVDSIWLSDHLLPEFPSYDASTALAMFVARTRGLTRPVAATPLGCGMLFEKLAEGQ